MNTMPYLFADYTVQNVKLPSNVSTMVVTVDSAIY